jgi:hypothetical protein
MSNYTIEIVSHHPKFNQKSLKKYYVEGIETVGAWGDEPFEIRFKNNTWQKVQVKISLDGTDILSGKPANTEISKDMWVVNGYDTLSLKAWPETNNGGAGFVFTSANNSVALHTHGDLSSRGIIAAAVFVEGHVEPIKLTPPVRVEEHHHHYPPYYPPSNPWTSPYHPIWSYNNNVTYTGSTIGDFTRGKGMTHNSITPQAASYNSNTLGGATLDSLHYSDTSDADGLDLESLVSVGAGQHVDQKITYVSGLTKPVFSETVRVKYVWWDDLVAKLRTTTAAQAQPSGFPGDAKQKNIDLKGTPRVRGKRGSFQRAETQQPVFNRF